MLGHLAGFLEVVQAENLSMPFKLKTSKETFVTLCVQVLLSVDNVLRILIKSIAAVNANITFFSFFFFSDCFNIPHTF